MFASRTAGILASRGSGAALKPPYRSRHEGDERTGRTRGSIVTPDRAQALAQRPASPRALCQAMERSRGDASRRQCFVSFHGRGPRVDRVCHRLTSPRHLGRVRSPTAKGKPTRPHQQPRWEPPSGTTATRRAHERRAARRAPERASDLRGGEAAANSPRSPGRCGRRGNRRRHAAPSPTNLSAFSWASSRRPTRAMTPRPRRRPNAVTTRHAAPSDPKTSVDSRQTRTSPPGVPPRA